MSHSIWPTFSRPQLNFSSIGEHWFYLRIKTLPKNHRVWGNQSSRSCLNFHYTLFTYICKHKVSTQFCSKCHSLIFICIFNLDLFITIHPSFSRSQCPPVRKTIIFVLSRLTLETIQLVLQTCRSAWYKYCIIGKKGAKIFWYFVIICILCLPFLDTSTASLLRKKENMRGLNTQACFTPRGHSKKIIIGIWTFVTYTC